MKFFTKALFILFFFPTILKAQSNYHPGYVVNLHGDTLKGTIDFKEWYNNPREIKFKENNSNTINQYGPANTLGFGVTGYEYYKSFTVPISQDQTEMAKLSQGIDTTVVIDNVFLKTIVAGKNVSLYTYYDGKLRLFLQVGNGRPVPLVQHIFFGPTGNLVYDNTYKQQLKDQAEAFQPGNTKLIKNIEESDYILDYIEPDVLSINGLTHNPKPHLTNNPSGRFFVGAGLSYSTMAFAVETAKGSLDKAASSLMPQLNVGYDFYPNKDIGKVIFRGELSFFGTKGDISRQPPNLTYSPVSDIESIKFTQFVTAINPQIIYNIYNEKSFKFYLDAGFVFNYSIYMNKQHTDTYINSTLPNYNYPFIHTEPYYYTFSGQLGIVLNNRIEIYAGYYPSTYFIRDQYTAYSLHITSYKAGVNYFLGKKIK